MTVGKDVSSLFTDVVNCMQTENLELKKLVYLYLINYAKSQPDLAILAVNTFVKVKLTIMQLFAYTIWFSNCCHSTSQLHHHHSLVESLMHPYWSTSYQTYWSNKF